MNRLSRSEFVVRLTQLLRDKKLTRRDLAKRLGKPLSAVHNHFHASSPTVYDDTVISVCKALDVDTAYFFTPEDSKELPVSSMEIIADLAEVTQ